MFNYDRGGKILETGEIGRLSFPRQFIALPGEKVDLGFSGSVRLAPTRQQTAIYLHASIETFCQPLRWLVPNFPAYLQEGRTTSHTIPALDSAWSGSKNARRMGIGAPEFNAAQFYALGPQRIWNKYYRWSEDTEYSKTVPDLTFFGTHGPKAVNLERASTRIHNTVVVDTTEVDVASSTSFDVRTLAEIKGRAGQALLSDWTNEKADRYNVFMAQIYKGAKGNNEVDQIPYRLRGGSKLSVEPKTIRATDGDSLGKVSSLSNFGVDVNFDKYFCNEHMLFTTVLLLRFAPVFAKPINPLAYPADMMYEQMQGDPEVLKSIPPQSVKERMFENGGASVIGVLPASWPFQTRWDHVSYEHDDLNSFPILGNAPLTAKGFRDATVIDNLFETQILRDWDADLDCRCNVDSLIYPAGYSIMAGTGKRGPKGNHPTGGYLK